MVTVDEIRRLALSLPKASEEGHHGMPSFRIAKKIFATIPDNEHVHVMVEPDEADMAVSAAPDAVEELWWGERRAGVRVKLAAADLHLLSVLLSEAWRRKAPRKLASLFDSSKR